MYTVLIYDNKALLIEDATEAKVDDTRYGVEFYDQYGNLIAFFKLDEIKGFYQSNEPGIYAKESNQ